jgi:hypothetical protein
MSRRRPDYALEYERFGYYIINYAGMYKYNNSYIFGQYLNGFFVPTHFAPSGLKEGAKMINDLQKYDNIIFVVTEDLIPMLQKAGYKIIPKRLGEVL